MNDGSASIKEIEQSDVSEAGAIAARVLADITTMLNAENIYTNAVQQQMLE